MSTSSADYRQSHTDAAHARRYHDRFLRNSHRQGMWKLEQACLAQIVRKHGLGPDAAYLDFACGTGRVTQYMAGFFPRAYGVDISGAMLGIAREETRAVTFVEGDLTTNPAVLPPIAFNVVTAFRFFPNAQAELRHQALAAIRERMAPGGLLVWNNHLNVDSTMLRLARTLTRDPASRLGMSIPEMDRLMADHGFTVVERYGLGALPFNDRVNLLGTGPLLLTERMLGRLPLPLGMHQDIIYVARKS